jgi:hypothetical protein
MFEEFAQSQQCSRVMKGWPSHMLTDAIIQEWARSTQLSCEARRPQHGCTMSTSSTTPQRPKSEPSPQPSAWKKVLSTISTMERLKIWMRSKELIRVCLDMDAEAVREDAQEEGRHAREEVLKCGTNSSLVGAQERNVGSLVYWLQICRWSGSVIVGSQYGSVDLYSSTIHI